MVRCVATLSNTQCTSTHSTNNMTRLTEYSSYADAQTFFSSERLWELFEGDRQRLNIAHECVDRHAGSKQTAVIVIRADGADEENHGHWT